MRQPLSALGCSLRIYGDSLRAVDLTIQACLNWFASVGIPSAAVAATIQSGQHPAAQFQLLPEYAEAWLPNSDTLELARRLGLASRHNPADLEQEILVAMLGSPMPFEFPSGEEFESAVRIRKSIAEAARKTRLEFRTHEAERPEDYWRYDDDRGFILRPGRCLVDALVQATQPEASGRLYSFSCWRATEYVALLGIAREVIDRNPALYERLSRQAETRALKAAAFERACLRKHGSITQPLPPRYFVPGDRTWFRNPDRISADITGYEGSFTFYLGAGEFADFWRPGLTYTLATKCLTIYHWRNGVVHDADGDPQIDEAIVERRVQESLDDPQDTRRILEEMVRVQDPPDVFDGGCIEPHRETPRMVCPGTEDLGLPDVDAASKPVRRTDARLQPHA